LTPPPNSIDEQAMAELRTLFADDTSGLNSFIGEFLDSTEELLRAIESALDAGSAEKAAKVAHQVISSAKSFGANAFSALARRTEQAAKGGDIEEARRRLHEMKLEFALVKTALGTYR
jgi:HPt (histidine-containing phosphotransfer) domain-containing protein